jgi:hypothetical protein
MMQETQMRLTKAPSATFQNKSFENYLDKIRFKKEEKTVVTTVAGDGDPGLLNGPSLRAKI